MNPVQLSIFSSKIASICDEMSAVLQRSAFSPNIRDRLDYSCAIFGANGELCAQAAHIPVHLGSMAYAMTDLVSQVDWEDGDMIVVNDPYLGGTHLPDVTVISPLFIADQLIGFVANRAHHADIGGDSPGSMPISSSLEEEGLLLPPQHLLRKDEIVNENWKAIFDLLGNGSDTKGDFLAQIAANKKGRLRLGSLVTHYGVDQFANAIKELNQYGETLARSVYESIPDGEYHALDYMDDDGQGTQQIPIKLRMSVQNAHIDLDFSGTNDQVKGNINCPISVAAAAAFYVFRCLLPDYAPACAGIFEPIKLSAPEGCLVNARRPAAVAAGNVETSSRIVDLVMSALRQAIPNLIPADSQGTMNNIAMGSVQTELQPAWSYYETIGGGMGASKYTQGLSGVQTHMTNTLNTPIEVLETSFPIRVNEYSLRANSGGLGQNKGGDGLIREYEFLSSAQLTLLTERRLNQPKGVGSGGAGKAGVNLLNGEKLPPKIELSVNTGDCIRIETPGGGGYGMGGDFEK